MQVFYATDFYGGEAVTHTYCSHYCRLNAAAVDLKEIHLENEGTSEFNERCERCQRVISSAR